MSYEEWYNEDSAANIINRDFVDASPYIDRELFAKHLNLAFQKGSQIGSGQTRAELDLVSAELERVKAERPNVGELNQAKSERQTALTELGKALAELRSLKSELDFLKSHIKSELERIVCTEGEDAGVFFLSPESPSNYDPELNCHVYVHEHFSELGGALVNLYKTVVSKGGEG
jgi:hypothetical protein